ncbi:MAG: hypothetical protein QW260_05585 [Thermoproteota archaeon]
MRHDAGKYAGNVAALLCGAGRRHPPDMGEKSGKGPALLPAASSRPVDEGER